MNERSGRIPCINPKCRRTAPADKFGEGEEIVCYKCWKLLPKRLTARYRALRKREKKLIRLIERKFVRQEMDIGRAHNIKDSLHHLMKLNWLDIRSFFLKPESPEGLESFLDEIGLK